jgi:AraC-like DNA-binding protein
MTEKDYPFMLKVNKISCSLLFINRYRFAQGHMARRHSHRFWQIEIIENGRIKAQVNDDCRILSGGWIMLIPPAYEHCFQYLEDATHATSIKFDMKLNGKCNAAWIGPSLLNSHIAGAIAQLLGLGRFASEAIHPSMEHLLSALVSALLFAQTDARTELPDIHAARRVHDAVVTCATWPLRIDSLGHDLGLSVSRISHAFAETYKQSLKSFIDRTRKEIIERHLRYSDMSIKEIALTMGFDNAQAFSRFCRHHTGAGPRMLRERLRRED